MQVWIQQRLSPIFLFWTLTKSNLTKNNLLASDKNKGLLLGTIAVFLFSFTLPLSSYVTEQLDPWFVGLGRTAFGGILAATILWLKGVSRPNNYQLKWL